MILHAQWRGHHQSSKPVLVWLHGFLGNARDWQAVQSDFVDWPCLSVDLPGHGGSRAQQIDGFPALCQRLSATLQAHQVRRYWLIGYSLGGRIAMYYACRAALAGLCGVVVEAGHPGLSNACERQQRYEADSEWAQRFRCAPLTQTLEAWYQQPLFAELTEKQRQRLIAERAEGYGPELAAMLEATSLSRQPDLLSELRQLSVPLHYLCGEQDNKFKQLAQRCTLPLTLIEAAGHNAHRANPAAFARRLAPMLRQPV
ncbi:2-succinyl-6-hydroxy-2,4-cyclohexadiene-1-carboxylate synthase [Paramixta manurensis]|uniref:2-succinyl-6-hydroxy-2,4-cyclohexadiene-1-carboxylate synthase n=1 Tax=Paramixta manurensis TaxID=2740817 RepID=A0A6M8UEA1_9GAMM|nr:2-succinyl-6-hydroxy-2,4-cyclohexadiene-1-carboxylate synthase [Erwiniaceae bacterium PD-1]